MLVCISANPAIDRRLRLENIAVGEVNRALSANCLADAPGRVEGGDISRLAREIRVRRIVARESSQSATVEVQ